MPVHPLPHPSGASPQPGGADPFPILDRPERSDRPDRLDPERPPSGPGPTLAQVAAHAGVSSATASRVLNRSAPVSAQIAARVESAVRELRYVRRRASAATSRDTGAIAVVAFADVLRFHADQFPVRLLAGAQRVVPDRELVVLTAGPGPARPSLVRYLCGGHVDGVLLVGRWGDPALPGLVQAAGVPVVALGRPPQSQRLAHVDADNLSGARAAVRLLHRAGRRRIATIAGPPDTAAGADRLAGYRRALLDHGDPTRCAVAYGDFGSRSGEHAMVRLLDQFPDVDAVFAASDAMAVGALRALRRLGRRVPDDVAVVGFDDSPAAASARPGLTTVRQPVEDLGARAVELLRDPSPTRSVVLPTHLVVRQSC
ncbi:LacI family DNA-binding transcriptional regulator [Kitasatospora griseola]|uniref:LacI family DNA-binding transcriptional regulator n=1 Tax=Kitasatospora griseola TaxID=2064 RepID=UPI001999504C|nr:LacI family DNA-binding transcriptional regulator [Kitasatospora griseola]GGQ65098.1 LacI family transcriptional regulator [Kitasatospora griseola]